MFIYTRETINNLERTLSSDRLSTYFKETNNDKEKALELYLKNVQTSSSLYPSLQCLEIAVRNALHYELSQFYKTEAWYNQIELDLGGTKILKRTQENLKKTQTKVDPPHTVAALSFGFWLSLLNGKYHRTLWVPGLHKAFPYAHIKRAKIIKNLDHLRTLRNRIAHHEPIFKRHLEKDYENIITSIGWICPDTAQWTEYNHPFTTTNKPL